jgi:HD-GYP domain-containing protein (c-di-GMP phosphodiesterase class II)
MDLNLSEMELYELELFVTLHDLGKVGIDDRILTKPGRLTPEEWEEMKKHPEIGYRIAVSSPELAPIADLILSHHERWDGRGYPRGLEGENIPLLARILTIADAYDAMTEDRVYRNAMTKEDAIAEIKRNSGEQFDPVIVESFMKVVRQIDQTIF